jgi:acyl carrier protein
MPHDPLRALIAETLLIDVNQVDEDSGVDRTENWDSLRNMMIMAEVERVFAIKIAFRDYIEVGTVKGIRALIEKSRPGSLT